MKDEFLMKIALTQALKAYEQDEVPVGAIIIKDRQVVGYGFNNREQNNDVLGHAEIQAIKMAQETLHSWRLNDCELYVTLEPCLMCCGAIIQSRIKRVVYGAKDEKNGAVESLIHSFDLQGLNHVVSYTSGIMEKECSELLKNYFKDKRNKV